PGFTYCVPPGHTASASRFPRRLRGLRLCNSLRSSSGHPNLSFLESPMADAGICLPSVVYYCRLSTREPTQYARLRDQSDSKCHQRKNPHQTFRQPPRAEEPRDTAVTENDRNDEQQLITVEKPDSTPPQPRSEPAATPEVQTKLARSPQTCAQHECADNQEKSDKDLQQYGSNLRSQDNQDSGCQGTEPHPHERVWAIEPALSVGQRIR